MPSSSQIRPLGTPRYAVGAVIAGKYRLESILGEGGMGTVWHALNLQLEAPVALKLIRSELDREISTLRLKQEARAAARLGHPSIVRVFDVGESEFGDPFIVMELLHGESLSQLLVKEHRLSAVRAAQLLLPVADALSVAHAKGIVHRDLKPDNVFLAVEEDQLQPKLVDFGIAKLAGQPSHDKHLTQAGTVLGSPEYMSPEQARGSEDVDYRTDIWSFCVVLYEAVAGVTPFAGVNYNALLRSIVEDEPPSLLSYLASDESLWEIIQRGLHKQADQRYRSINELGRALAAWLVRQGVREDICGGSLESKWINRQSDPSSLGAQRASFASLSGVVPESGVRGAQHISAANAPTLGLEAPAAEPDRLGAEAGKRWLTPARGAAVLGAFIVLGASAMVLSSRRAEAPAVAPSPPPAPQYQARATQAATAAPERSSSAAVMAPPVVEAAPSAPVASKPGRFPARNKKRGSAPPSAVAPAPDAPKTNAATAKAGDLLAPY